MEIKTCTLVIKTIYIYTLFYFYPYIRIFLIDFRERERERHQHEKYLLVAFCTRPVQWSDLKPFFIFYFTYLSICLFVCVFVCLFLVYRLTLQLNEPPRQGYTRYSWSHVLQVLWGPHRNNPLGDHIDSRVKLPV